MSKPARADYGVDAQIAVRNMLIVCALGIISLITRVAGVWDRESAFALLGRPLISAGLASGVMAVWMILSSKFGKVRDAKSISTSSNGAATSACSMWAAGAGCS